MKILLLGNPYFRRDFEELGHQVTTVGFERPADIQVDRIPARIDDVLACLPAGWEPDLVMLGDESGHPWFVGLEAIAVPLVWYAIDSHIHLAWHRAYAAAFDIVLVAQKSYLDHYCRDAGRQTVCWFPLFCDPAVDRRLDLPTSYDLSFVGTLNPRLNPNRVCFIRAIQERFPLHVATGDYVETFNRSKLVLNQCAANDVNFRTFQTLACGRPLLMERVGNGLDELFSDREHLVLYDRGNVDQVVELACYYAAHEQEREEIAARGREAVLRAHTSRHRAEALLELLRGCNLHDAVRRRKAALREIQARLASVYAHAAGAYRLSASEQPAGSPLATARRTVGDAFAALSRTMRREPGPPSGFEEASRDGGRGPAATLRLLQLLHGNPYEGFDYRRYTMDLQGWGSQDPLFHALIREVRPRLIIEVGTWKGASAVFMASYLRSQGIQGQIVCVDTWLGSLEHLSNAGSLQRVHGYPTLYYQFLANVMHMNLQDSIVPLPLPSAIASRWFALHRIQADLIYLDGSHDAEDVYLDLRRYWALVRDGGILFGDDYCGAWPGTVAAVNQFARDWGLRLDIVGLKWVIRKASCVSGAGGQAADREPLAEGSINRGVPA